MSQFKKIINAAMLLMLVVYSVANGSFADLFIPTKALAGGCPSASSIVGTNIVIYSDGASDPQSLIIGQAHAKYQLEFQGADPETGIMCPANVIVDGGLKANLTVAESGVLSLATNASGDPLPAGNVVTISKNTARKSFYLRPVAMPVNNPIVVTATPSNVIPAENTATQYINVIAPAPDNSKIHAVNNTHGLVDQIYGDSGTVPNTTTVPGGVTLKVFSDLAGTDQISTITANTDGSFNPISTGDDLYRTVYLRAYYPGTTQVSSDPVLIGQDYPSTVTNLTSSHINNTSGDFVKLAWVGDDTSTFRIYRAEITTINPDPVLTESNFIGTSDIPEFVDNTAGYVFGKPFRYAIKQVISGSYTPEFLPTIDARIDISSGVVSPTPNLNIASGVKSPIVTAQISSDLQDSIVNWILAISGDPSLFNMGTAPVRIKFTNVTDGKLYYANFDIDSYGALETTRVSDGTNFYDAEMNTYSILADGAYKIELIAYDHGSGIDDKVTVSSNYVIDVTKPLAPIQNKLRYNNGILSGVAGAVEPGVNVEIFSSAPGVGDSIGNLGETTSNTDGSFSYSGTLSVPIGDNYYLVAKDQVGNLSDYTAYDVIATPQTPDSTRLVMHQNKPGTDDMIEGKLGAVGPSAIVRVYIADPVTNANLIPSYEFEANADGSFSKKVGDNISSAYWVATWNGVGNVISASAKLSNRVYIAPTTSLYATTADGSVTLHWALVAGADYYLASVYDTTDGKFIYQELVVASTQSSLQISLANGHSYRFDLYAVDKYGNISKVTQTSATPQAAAVETVATATYRYASSSTVTTPTPTETTAPSPAPSPAPDSAPKNWTPWIIVIGLVILLVAAISGYYVWIKEPVEIMTGTAKKKVGNNNKPNPSNKKKPRW